jgi:glycosidase
MLNFLENHDEQRFASPQYAGNADLVTPSLIVSATISTGPFMIYAGQELGERATDAEGYSGQDGRSTIFDYWSIAVIRKWLNRGKCDGLLSYSEQRLRALYSRVLQLCNQEKAISRGAFFDLMYVNYDNPRINPHRHYAYLRHYDNELLVILVNFSDDEAQVEVNLPSHAFDYLKMPRGFARSIDLLSGQESLKALSDSIPFASRIPAHGAVIWKVDLSKMKNV